MIDQTFEVPVINNDDW